MVSGVAPEHSVECARVNRLDKENTRLVQRDVEIAGMKGLLRKKCWAPAKQEGARVLKAKRISMWRIAALFGSSWSSRRYRIRAKPRGQLVGRVEALRLEHTRYGQVRILALLQRASVVVKHKGLSRLRQKLWLQLTRRPTRTKVRNGEVALRTSEDPYPVWTYDFVFAWTLGGTHMRFLTPEHENTREPLVIDLGRAFKALQVHEVLAQGICERCVPEFIFMEFGLRLLVQGIGIQLIDNGKPWQNSFAESSSAKFRDKNLNGELFHEVPEANVITQALQNRIGERQQHLNMGFHTPNEFSTLCALVTLPLDRLEFMTWATPSATRKRAVRIQHPSIVGPRSALGSDLCVAISSEQGLEALK